MKLAESNAYEVRFEGKDDVYLPTIFIKAVTFRDAMEIAEMYCKEHDYLGVKEIAKFDNPLIYKTL